MVKKLVKEVRRAAAAWAVWYMACSGCAPPNRLQQPSTVDNPSVVFSRKSLDDFVRGYDQVTKSNHLEYGWCLRGSKKGSKYFIDSTSVPQIYHTSNHSIQMSCPSGDDLVGMAHSHDSSVPVNNPCSPSLIDVFGFGQNGLPVNSVVCEDSVVTYVRK